MSVTDSRSVALLPVRRTTCGETFTPQRPGTWLSLALGCRPGSRWCLPCLQTGSDTVRGEKLNDIIDAASSFTFKKGVGSVWRSASVSAIVHAPVCKLRRCRELQKERERERGCVIITLQTVAGASPEKSKQCQQLLKIVLGSVKSKHLSRYQIMTTMSLCSTGSE